jgi:hypothetical protein
MSRRMNRLHRDCECDNLGRFRGFKETNFVMAVLREDRFALRKCVKTRNLSLGSDSIRIKAPVSAGIKAAQEPSLSKAAYKSVISRRYRHDQVGERE